MEIEIDNMRILISFLTCCVILSCQNKENQFVDVAPNPDLKKTETVKVNQLDSQESVDMVMGDFDPKTHPIFVEVDKKYADREGLYLHKETYQAFEKMYAAASKDNINLVIRSATRNFKYQKGIWERKWNGTTKIENGKNAALAYPAFNRRAQKILEYSSMPGTSRHHWGTDIDLNNFENVYFESGQGLKVYEWLTANAGTYGFCQVYTKKGEKRPNGYNEEKWHWSYLPVAKKLLRVAKDSLNDSMISGFTGSEVATDLHVIENYVFGINPDCL